MTNPYAYHEESSEAVPPGDWGNEETAGQEPLTPFELLLSGGAFKGITKLTVFHDRCELVPAGGSADDIITISRNEAAERIQLKATKLIIHSTQEKKRSFRFKRDKQQELKRARLEAWCKHDWAHDPAGAHHAVLSLFKRNVCAPVIGLMLFMAVLQAGYYVIQLVDYLQGNWDNEFESVFIAFLHILHASPALTSLAFAFLLWRRQIWALILGGVLSLLPLIGCFLVLIIPTPQTRMILFCMTLICFAVTYAFTNATVRYFSQVSAMKDQNRTAQ